MLLKTNVSIKTKTHEFKGFDVISIQKSMGRLFNEFDFVIADRRLNGAKMPLKMGELCTVYLNDKILETGYLDFLNHSFSHDGTLLEIYGRSLACDVDDSTTLVDVTEFKGKQNVANIFKKLVDPFSLKLSFDPNSADLTLKDWRIEPGERVGENLFRAAQKLGFMIYSLPDGSLRASNASQKAVFLPVIAQGFSLIEAYKRYDYSNLFSKYTVKTQSKQGEGRASLKAGVSENPSIRKTRVISCYYDGFGSKEEAQKMAEWELSTRQANAFEITAKVAGWLNPKSEPWQLNSQVLLDCERINVKENLLITEISFDYYPEEGHTTTLTLRHPEAFLPKPFDPEPKKVNDGWNEKIKSLGY